jgi:hypothetical protein
VGVSRVRCWVWFGQTSHRIHGYGNSFNYGLRDHWQDAHLREAPDYVEQTFFVTCLTKCGLRVQVHVPPDGVLADAAQPKGRPACKVCVAADRAEKVKKS